MILAHDLVTNPKTEGIFRNLPPTSILIDVGCGIRPCPLECRRHIGIEPHEEYIRHLSAWNPAGRKVEIVQGEAEAVGLYDRKDTTVLLLDVIEHMERDRGESIRDLLEEFEHAIIFTPLGWYEQGEQNPDCWGLNGGFWQKHRSAWQPDDFKNWRLHVWKEWHPINGCGAILAIR